MGLSFTPPPDWLAQEYVNRKSPGQTALDSAQQAAQLYVTLKTQKTTQDLAQQAKDIEVAKGLAANGQDFMDAYKQVIAARTPAAKVPFSTPRDPSALGGSLNPDTVNPEANDYSPHIAASLAMGHTPVTGLDYSSYTQPLQSQPPTPSTGTVQSPMTTNIATDPLVQEYQKDPLAFKKQHGATGMTKLSTQVGIDKSLESNDYTADQATKLLKDNPNATDVIASFPKDKVPKDVVHLLMAQGRSKDSEGNVNFAGVDAGGFPITMDKKGKMTLRGQPYDGPVYPKSSDIPTSASRTSAESAKNILGQINKIKPLLDEANKRGLIGPVAGRFFNQFEAGKVGTTGNPDNDKLLGQIRAFDTFIKSGALKVHFGARGGQQMYENFNNILNSGKQSLDQYNGALDSISSVLEGYAKEGTIGGGSSSEPPSANPDLIHLSTVDLQKMREKLTAHKSNGN